MNAAVRGEVAAARGMTTLSAEIGAGAETTTRVTATAAKGLTAKWPQPARPRAVVLTPPRAEAEAAKATAAAEDNDGDEGGLDEESESDSLSDSEIPEPAAAEPGGASSGPAAATAADAPATSGTAMPPPEPKKQPRGGSVAPSETADKHGRYWCPVCERSVGGGGSRVLAAQTQPLPLGLLRVPHVPQAKKLRPVPKRGQAVVQGPEGQ